jgi:hypothetical protein
MFWRARYLVDGLLPSPRKCAAMRIQSCPKQLFANLVLDRLRTVGASLPRVNSCGKAVERHI